MIPIFVDLEIQFFPYPQTLSQMFTSFSAACSGFADASGQRQPQISSSHLWASFLVQTLVQYCFTTSMAFPYFKLIFGNYLVQFFEFSSEGKFVYIA